MHLLELELEEFRSYRRLSLELSEAGLRLVGANASGKSTLLEAIAMLATTRSPRSGSEREVIRWQSGQDLGFPPYARLRGLVQRRTDRVEVEIGLQTDPGRPGTLRKQIRLGGRSVRAMDAVGALKAVLFSAEDVALISGPPSGRRRYLDLTISQVDGDYLRALARYTRVLTQRNGLLKTLARDRVAPQAAAAGQQLMFWDGELVALGSAIVARRLIIVNRLARLAEDRFQQLSPGGRLAIVYRPTFPLPAATDGQETRPLDQLQAIVAREFEEHLSRSRADEVRRGASLVGPHRDDLGIELDDADLGTFGSRGQHRLGVLALKLAETAMMAEEAGEAPVLLLDDVMSELDAAHRSLLSATAGELGAQVIVTATDDNLLLGAGWESLPQARIEATSLRFG